jgi:hypothetical protein
MRLLDGTLVQGDVSAISFGPSSAARASTPTARRFPAATAATPA